MIKNDRQAAIARRKLEDVERSREAAVQEDQEQYERLATRIRKDIDEYDAIVAGKVVYFPFESVDELAEIAIKARIKRRLTHAELAERLGVSEQQVQKDEASTYERAGWDKIADVLDALDCEVVGAVRPCEDGPLSWTPTRPADYLGGSHRFTIDGIPWEHRARGTRPDRSTIFHTEVETSA